MDEYDVLGLAVVLTGAAPGLLLGLAVGAQRSAGMAALCGLIGAIGSLAGAFALSALVGPLNLGGIQGPVSYFGGAIAGSVAALLIAGRLIGAAPTTQALDRS